MNTWAVLIAAIALTAISSTEAVASRESRCIEARQLVKQHCGTQASGKQMSAARCARAKGWVRDRCTTTARVAPPPRLVRGITLARPRRVVPLVPIEARIVPPPTIRRWQGWQVTCCGAALAYNGRLYRAGPNDTPYGPPMPYNNFEGGLQATVFWQFKDRFPDGR
jgi:hypothetical protein